MSDSNYIDGLAAEAAKLFQEAYEHGVRDGAEQMRNVILQVASSAPMTLPLAPPEDKKDDAVSQPDSMPTFAVLEGTTQKRTWRSTLNSIAERGPSGSHPS